MKGQALGAIALLVSAALCANAIWVHGELQELRPVASAKPKPEPAVAKEAWSESSELLELGELERALDGRLKNLEEAIALEPADTAQEKLSKLRRMGTSRRSQVAVGLMREFLDEFPDHEESTWVAHELIASLLTQSRIDEARQVLESRRENVGWSFDLAFDQGAIHLYDKEFRKARRFYADLAQDERVNEFQALRSRFYEGYSLIQGGWFRESIPVFNKVIDEGEMRDDRRLDSLVEGARIQIRRAREWIRAERK